jgi:hypothetical protein
MNDTKYGSEGSASATGSPLTQEQVEGAAVKAATSQSAPETFAEYGNKGSIQESIEDLALQCVMVGIAPPTKIVFPKGELAKVNSILFRESEGTPKITATLSETPVVGELKQPWKSLGVVELVEEV